MFSFVYHIIQTKGIHLASELLLMFMYYILFAYSIIFIVLLISHLISQLLKGDPSVAGPSSRV